MNLKDMYRLFPTHNDCIHYLEKVRWQGKPVCPQCNTSRSTALKKEGRHHCNECNASFSVTAKTLFHHTHLPLQKWFLAITIILSARKSIAARKLAKELQVNKNTAWYLAMRVRRAMQESPEKRALVQGIVETLTS